MTEHVYAAANRNGGHSTVLHTDPACPQLQTARKIFRHPADAFPESTPRCQWCTGEYDLSDGNTGRSGTQLWEILERADPDLVGGE